MQSFEGRDVLRAALRKLGGIMLAASLMAAGYMWGASDTGVTAQDSTLLLTESERLTSEVYHRVSPSIVAIGIADPIFGQVSGGSGFVIDLDGHIITNYHVIEDAIDQETQIEVNFLDGTIVKAEVVGTDPDSDIALIKVALPPVRLLPVTLADSDEVVIGQSVLAIGSPFGQRWTLTSGIVSALDRTIDGLGSFQIGAVIQTDAAINPGNSGGPLLNLRGEVIGINSQIVSRGRQVANSGVGFAVPSNLVKRVIEELRANGFVDYAYMGVANVEEINLRIIERLDLPNDTRGVRIGAVTGPAASAGLLSNDIITAVDGYEIASFGSLIAYLAGNTRPEQTVQVMVLRGGQEVEVPVVLGRRQRPTP